MTLSFRVSAAVIQWPSLPTTFVGVAQVWSHCWTYLFDKVARKGLDNRFTWWQWWCVIRVTSWDLSQHGPRK